MRRVLPWIGTALAGMVAATAILVAFVSANLERTARQSLDGAHELFAARLAVAEAEKELGGGGIDDAIESARKANERAEEVGKITARLVATLNPAARTAGAITGSSRRSAQNVSFTRRQAEAANGLIGAVAGYQAAAARLAERTNTALERILKALRKTNRSFPGTGGP